MYEPIKTLEIGDRNYELILRRCPNCDCDHFNVYRWSGGSFARYHLPPDIREISDKEFEDFAHRVDEQLLKSSASLIEDFHYDLSKINSSEGIQADNTFEFLLAEYGRTRVSTLQRLGYMKYLLSENPSKNKVEEGIRSAFELGMAAAEHKLMKVYEDYILAGHDLEEWRTTGQPKATEARIRQGRKAKEAITKASQNLYAVEPDLMRNDLETCRRIHALNLPELQRGKGQTLSVSAIYKHLRDARKRI